MALADLEHQYAGLTMASYMGAASGPLISNFTVQGGGWRFTQW